MIIEEVIIQLRSLKKHCEDFSLEENDQFAKDVEALEIAIEKLSDDSILIKMVEYDGEPVPEELCSIDREGGADDFHGCGACFECEGHLDCSDCVVDKIFKHYAELTGQCKQN